MTYEKLPISCCNSLPLDSAARLEKMLRRKRPFTAKGQTGSCTYSARVDNANSKIRNVAGTLLVVTCAWTFNTTKSTCYDEMYIFRVDSGFGKRYYPLEAQWVSSDGERQIKSGIDGECPEDLRPFYRDSKAIQDSIEFDAVTLINRATKKGGVA